MADTITITYGTYHDDDGAVFCGHWWSEIRLNDAIILPSDELGVARPAATNFWLRCSAARDAKSRALKLAEDFPGVTARPEPR